MRVVVKAYPASDGPSRRSEACVLEIPCGSGEQLVRWLGHAACLKLAYSQRGIVRQYVPQAVISRDGCVLDADHVMKEVRRCRSIGKLTRGVRLSVQHKGAQMCGTASTRCALALAV